LTLRGTDTTLGKQIKKIELIERYHMCQCWTLDMSSIRSIGATEV